MNHYLNDASIRLKFVTDILNTEPDLQKIKLFVQTRRHTMVTPARLNNVYDLVKKINKDHFEGSLVECGVWKGGCAAVMGYSDKKYGGNRDIWLFDSFEGLPEPVEKDGQKAKNYASGRNTGALESIGDCVASENDVVEIFRKLLLLQDKIHIIKGWFQDTLPKTKKKIGPIALMRLDGDWYESTKICLDELYEQLVPGGYVIVDDYCHWEGCKKAVEEFIKKHNLNVDLHIVDNNTVYFQKP